MFHILRSTARLFAFSKLVDAARCCGLTDPTRSPSSSTSVKGQVQEARDTDAYPKCEFNFHDPSHFRSFPLSANRKFGNCLENSVICESRCQNHDPEQLFVYTRNRRSILAFEVLAKDCRYRHSEWQPSLKICPRSDSYLFSVPSIRV